MSQLRLEHLRALIALNDAGTFAAAAKKLFVTQPAFSAQIRYLEEYFGTQLVERRSKGKRTRLTKTGFLVLDYAREIVALMDKVKDLVDEEEGVAEGKVTISGGSTAGGCILPYVIGLFKQKYPQVHIALEISDTDSIVERLAQKVLDIGIIAKPCERSDILTEVFVDYRLCMVVPSFYPFDNYQKVSLKQLTGYPLLVHEKGTFSRSFIEQKLEAAGHPISEWHSIMELSNTGVMKLMVEAGLGIAFVSQWALGNSVELGTLKVLTTTDFEAHRQYYIARNSKRRLPRSAERLWDFLLTPGLEDMLKTVSTKGFSAAYNRTTGSV